MPRLRSSVVVAWLVLAGGAAQARDFDGCIRDSGGVSAAMLDCGAREIGAWDRRMNAAYQSLLAQGSAASRVRLREEQRAWLRHHLGETRRLASAPDNGSAAFLESQGFELGDLRQRTLLLEGQVSRGR